jgi:hypothetical protein
MGSWGFLKSFLIGYRWRSQIGVRQETAVVEQNYYVAPHPVYGKQWCAEHARHEQWRHEQWERQRERECRHYDW